MTDKNLDGVVEETSRVKKLSLPEFRDRHGCYDDGTKIRFKESVPVSGMTQVRLDSYTQREFECPSDWRDTDRTVYYIPSKHGSPQVQAAVVVLDDEPVLEFIGVSSRMTGVCYFGGRPNQRHHLIENARKLIEIYDHIEQQTQGD